MLKGSSAVVKTVATFLHSPPPCLCYPFIGCICVCLMKAVVWLQLNLKPTLSLERRSPVARAGDHPRPAVALAQAASGVGGCTHAQVGRL